MGISINKQHQRMVLGKLYIIIIINNNNKFTNLKCWAILGWFPISKLWFQTSVEQWGPYNLPESSRWLGLMVIMTIMTPCFPLFSTPQTPTMIVAWTAKLYTYLDAISISKYPAIQKFHRFSIHMQSSHSIPDINPITSGRWFNLPLWNIYLFVSWDNDIPNWMESHSKFHGSSHHQPVFLLNLPYMALNCGGIPSKPPTRHPMTSTFSDEFPNDLVHLTMPWAPQRSPPDRSEAELRFSTMEGRSIWRGKQNCL
jgi:hypothetical protein